MKSSHRTKIIFSLLFLYFFIDCYSQSTIHNDFIHQNLILSLEGGASYGFTDYKDAIFEPALQGSFEYYPVSSNRVRLGLKLYFGGTQLGLSDDRGSISNNDEPNPRNIPQDIFTDVINAGAMINFGLAIGNSVIPYIGVGGSYVEFNPKNPDGIRLDFNYQGRYDKKVFSLVVEGGAKIKLSDRFSLNTSISFYPTSTDYLDDVSAAQSNDSYITGLVGISYAFLGNFDSDDDGINNDLDQCPDTPPGVNVDEFGCPLDSDKDGIPDYLDNCPDTPVEVAVDEFGCPLDLDKDGIPDYLDKCPNTPLGSMVDKFGCPDSDKDGVSDYLDKCPNTPIGVKVDSIGCPIDSDKDGVPDYMDKCSNTPANTKVDSTGCPETNKETFYQFILRGDDTFTNNSSATIKEGAMLLLNEIAFYIQNQPGTIWRIEGHMDSQGVISVIKKLSYDRAKSVSDYLISKGVNVNQLSIYGLGDSFPIANNNTSEGRSTNRRILIIKED